MEKGILGIKKDPKNQMLFSFVVRNGEEWPSSDSGDSDYGPGCKRRHVEKQPADAKKFTKNRKRSPKAKRTSEAKQYKRKKANVTFRGESCSSTAVDEYDERASQTDSEATVSDDLSAIYADRDMAADGDRSNPWGQAVPDLVLIKIFRYVVDTAGAIPFLPSALRVCKLWNKVAGDPTLWKKMDLSYGWVKARDNTLEHLCENWLSQLNEINLSNWKDMTFSGLKADGVSAKNLSQIISKCSANLRLLNLSDNSLKGFNAVLKTIATTCSCLEILDISNAVFSSDFVSIDIEKLQRGCPLLKVLRLTNSQFRVSYASAQEKVSSPGFPLLQELSVGTTQTSSDRNGDILHRILKRSHGLKLLDLRGWAGLNGDCLQSLPVMDLERLYISGCSLAKYEGIEIIMSKWHHSLVELDLSWNIYPGMSLDMAMKKLASDPSTSRLEVLDLRGTQISAGRVKSLLEGCPRLRILSLESCRGLPRGMKKEYASDNLALLRRDIDSFIASEESV